MVVYNLIASLLLLTPTQETLKGILTVLGIVCSVSGILLTVAGMVRYVMSQAGDRGTDGRTAIVMGIGIALMLVPQVISHLHAERWIP